ncbi:MAG: hypothetical protein AAF199_07360, partial [Pseudomonadota bacterium]
MTFTWIRSTGPTATTAPRRRRWRALWNWRTGWLAAMAPGTELTALVRAGTYTNEWLTVLMPAGATATVAFESGTVMACTDITQVTGGSATDIYGDGTVALIGLGAEGLR